MTRRPLPLRSTLACLREAIAHGCRVPPGTYERRESDPVPPERVAEYHAGAVRGGTNVGRWAGREHVAGRYLDYCASAQGWAESEASEMGEPRAPHRLGAFSEVWADALAGLRGRVLRIEETRKGGAFPPPGALAIFSRGGGRGHVERVIEAATAGYWSIGANEGSRPGRWVYEWRSYGDAQLVGFCDADERSDEDLAWFGGERGRVPAYRAIDVSRWQWDVRWDLVAEDQDFAYIRATAGTEQDARFRHHVGGAVAAGLPVGLYHWLDQREPLGPQLAAIHEARRAVEDVVELLPAPDVEPHMGGHLDVTWWRESLPVVLDELGSSIVYGNRPDLLALGSDGPWVEHPLWRARYTMRSEPGELAGWPEWSVWQYRANAFPTVPPGRHPGVGKGRVDTDLNMARSIPWLPGRSLAA